MSSPMPFQESRPLPPYRSILAIDAKGFTDYPGSTHEHLSVQIKQIAGGALRDAGLDAEWSSPDFYGDTGDGFAVGMPTRVLPYLVHPFPELLQMRLEEHRRDRPGDVPLRLRVSIHVGPLPADDAEEPGQGNGQARNDTHRLLDSDVVKEALKKASPNVTLVAMIISDQVFRDVVAAGYSGLHPDHFVEAMATVKGKTFAQKAWLHLPEQSGRFDPAVNPDSTERPTTKAEPSTPALGEYRQIARKNIGGMHMNWGDRS